LLGWLQYLQLKLIILYYYRDLIEELIVTDILETIKKQIEENSIIIYMKGSPDQPQCGFSARAVQSLMSCGKRFAYVDILANPDIRTNLPKYANWPTFPQLWVNGELVGGCDIITEMEANGELLEVISKVEPENDSVSH
jgi:monothiol glutaredoxin